MPTTSREVWNLSTKFRAIEGEMVRKRPYWQKARQTVWFLPRRVCRSVRLGQAIPSCSQIWEQHWSWNRILTKHHGRSWQSLQVQDRIWLRNRGTVPVLSVNISSHSTTLCWRPSMTIRRRNIEWRKVAQSKGCRRLQGGRGCKRSQRPDWTSVSCMIRALDMWWKIRRSLWHMSNLPRAADSKELQIFEGFDFVA